MKIIKYDVCIIGSGAGAAPIAYELSKNGFNVIVIEKGPWFKTKDLSKDEITSTRRNVYTPLLQDEQHVIESRNSDGDWESKSTYSTGISYWNGNMVGGSTNLMSGYFHRMNPNDFKLLTTYGPIEGANITNWPIDYSEMEPYFDIVEKEIGISGRVVDHSTQEPRSKNHFPYPPLVENIVSSWIDNASNELGYDAVPIPRAILSLPEKNRSSCYYSNYCGSYGCSSDAKGSARVALLDKALITGKCTILPNSKVYKLETNGNGKIIRSWHYDDEGSKQSIEADLFVVACQAVETSRLLLMSKNEDFPVGLANNSGLVGKNLLFSAGGVGSGIFDYDNLKKSEAEQLKVPGLFVNRAIQHWYEIDDARLPDGQENEFPKKVKGGTVDFLFEHANGISKAIRNKWDEDGNLVYGSALKSKMKNYFLNQRKLNFEVFADWLPTDNCYVTLDDNVVDKWDDPVAKIRIDNHPHDLEVGKYLSKKAEDLMEKMGANDIKSSINGSPPTNLMAGGCRFGDDPKNSVLDRNCKAHEVDNLYVTDGSFMPTGGSVTYTWTIYANAFRVADIIIKRLRNG
ncbi:MAG TPA: GMC family oxidoreductase [Bacteroidales bacterium]|jgi:choline dehydrogenase-like flavoprotein|nr:GMC family oxidoreductase [Bacteroidales bacterium]|tara:strand:+ start:101 stop:1816 length:1716 start_codon:yes stop_codon:yes gene_type:complete